jgi:serine/threonine protein phosphatase PrpC
MFHSPKQTILRMGYRTEVGRVREHNEDSLKWFEPKRKTPASDEKGWLYVVADGIGGYTAGEVASKIAVDVVVHYFEVAQQPVINALQGAIKEANLQIFQSNRKGSEIGMGTTIVCAAIVDEGLYLAHVGDSRAYLLRDQHLSLLTLDHTLVNDLLKAGAITPEEASTHPQRHVLSRALGKKQEVIPEIHGPLFLDENDMILLCTDGISGYIDDAQISYILQTNADDPQAAVNALIQFADTIGGEDNATAIAVLVDQKKRSHH